MTASPDPVYKQMDYLAQQMTALEQAMAAQIDPREFGKLEGAVDALKTDVDQLKGNVKELSQKMDQVLEKLSEAKGGWRALMLLGGAGATLGSFVTWFFTHTVSIGPKG